ncbi:DNA-packaging protein, partial [Escherichia coli]|nr:DNA-packaging protein [Escherichia coli]
TELTDVTFDRFVVGVDPAVTSSEDADETGIVVAARSAAGHYYVLEDLSRRATPLEWARVVRRAAREHGAVIVAEANQGGELV